jgi:rhamnogalacturonan acetylesterase
MKNTAILPRPFHWIVRLNRPGIAFAILGLFLAGCQSTDTTTATSKTPEIAEANEIAAATKPAAAETQRTLPELFIVGDSTVHNTSPGLVGWGDVIGGYFDPAKIKVENRAHAGRSTRTFQSQGWWAQVLADAQPGDFIIIQLGHNDSSPINDTNRSRGTIPGIGDESTNIVNGLTHQPETVRTYGWYLRQYIADARAKGMTPILCTPVSRLPTPGKELDTTRSAAWMREVAAREQVPLIDLNRLVLARWDGMTPGEIKTNYFVAKDNTHFSLAGAELNAACVIEGLRELKDSPLNDYILNQSKPPPSN